MEDPFPTKTPDPIASHPLVIGVDGGGTKTLAWLAPLADDGSGVVLGRGLAGPGNPRAVGFETAQANIETAIAAALADARLPRAAVAAACLGLAGAGRPAEQERIAAWAAGRGLATKIKVTDDAEPVLAAAAPDNCGLALIAGTGSLALGRSRTGQTARSGGWGYLLGDEGSGYAIALAGLRAAMRSADGRGPTTDLLPAYLEVLSAGSVQELIACVYSPEMTRDRLAGLASVVFDLAASDDVAAQIVRAAVHDLAELVAVVAGRLRLTAGQYTLALAGGALLHQPGYLDRVVPAVLGALHDAPPQRWAIVPEPVLGAVALARSL